LINRDVLAVASSPKLLAKGAGMRLLSSSRRPRRLKDLVINQIIKQFPNFVAREYRSRGLPHKLSGLVVDGITEQCPNPESWITLSDKNDALGVPIARVDWRICQAARRSLIRLGHLLATELPRAGLPAPLLEEWVMKDRPQDSVIIDMGHLRAQRECRSNDPKSGVVDANCQVHGIARLYVSGASVFPTCGNTNPTLMIL
jgi:choline dehydrogenase-like flavoprotein